MLSLFIIGNFIYPLLEENLPFKIYCIDLSPRAIEFVKQSPLYSPEKIIAFPCDVSVTDCFANESIEEIDIASMIFVMSAIRPTLFKTVIENIYKVLKPNGLLIFRDYAENDMAMFRFKQGSKISERHYVRQDGTVKIHKYNILIFVLFTSYLFGSVDLLVHNIYKYFQQSG